MCVRVRWRLRDVFGAGKLVLKYRYSIRVCTRTDAQWAAGGQEAAPKDEQVDSSEEGAEGATDEGVEAIDGVSDGGAEGLVFKGKGKKGKKKK